ncbi:MAG: hypothetical protein RLZZ28_2527 [Bacteroidota bacterium]
MKKNSLVLCILISVCSVVKATVQPARIFSDSMVLQRGMKIPVWGWAGPGEKITVQINKQTKSTTAAANGKWRVELDPEKEGGPYVLNIRGTNLVSVKDVLIGDVWLCSGQSNMEWVVKNSKNSSQEISAANYPQIRHIKVPNTIGDQPKDEFEKLGNWKTATAANIGDFTAVGYFFARELYNQLKVPIGLINSSWGGTDVETWTSREAFQGAEEFKAMINDLPRLNLDSMVVYQERKMLATIAKVQGMLADNVRLTQFKKNDIDESKLPHSKLPGLWEQQSLPDIDGVVWFRKEIFVKPEDAGKPAEISLGVIDDNDETFLNGKKIGSTNGYNLNRIYKIEAGILMPGKNVMLVKVEDTGGGGGFYGNADDMKITIGQTQISLAGNWAFLVESLGKANAVGPNSYPSLLFNAMINPLIPFAIKGAIWYQGESNAGRAYQYRKAFPLMINDWRKRWNQGNFPFYFVQLASFNSANGNSEKGSTWAELREAQTLTLALPNTGMAVTTDIGEPKDIHPKNKQDVGKRLAANAFYGSYGMKNTIYRGPVFSRMQVTQDQARIDFVTDGTALQIQGTSLNGFEIAGSDKHFYPAKARLEGNSVVLSSDKVTAPVHVRFGWADDNSNCNLFNKEGFPALPFRTDSWGGITEKIKYRNK